MTPSGGAVLRRGLRRLQPALPAAVICAFLALVPFPTCLLRLTLGVPCPACGLTRSVLSAAHLDLAAAHRFHPLGPSLLVLAALTSALAFVATESLWRRTVRWGLGVAGVSLIVMWGLRFAGFFGGPAP